MHAAPTTFGTLPALLIKADDGAQAIVTLYGAHLVSWKSANGQERLFCSAASALDGSRAIRGGVPVIFPQFGERGSGMRHGFARVCNWRALDSGNDGDAAYAQFELTGHDLPASMAQAWPHAFALRLRVAVRANELELTLDVCNTGEAPWSFCAALHTYYLIEQLNQLRIGGLQDVQYSDASGLAHQREAALAIDDHLVRIYHHTPGALTLACGPDTLRLEQSGFMDAVVWNPGARDAAALSDMRDEEFERFVCIEPALIDAQLLSPGANWCGQHRVSATPAKN